MNAYFETLNKVFDLWNERHIIWCLIRNHEFLKTKNFYEGGDLDVLVPRDHLELAEEALKKAGFVKLNLSPLTHHIGYVKYIPEVQLMISIHLHIEHVYGAQLPYFDGNQMLIRRKKVEKYYVADDCDYLSVLLLHCILNKGAFVPKYSWIIKKFKKQCSPAQIEERLVFALGKKWAQIVSSRPNVTLNIPRIKRGFEWRSLFSYLWIKYGTAVWKLFHPAPLVSIIGMDGTGKTTVTQSIAKILDLSLVNVAVIYSGRGKNNILPIQRIGRTVKKNVDAQKKESVGISLLYTLAAPVFAADLWARSLFKISPSRVMNHIVITDRYASDLLLMKHVPEFLKNLLFHLMPKASETVYLYNKPEILIKRKPDHSLDDLKRQEKLFETIVAKTHATKVLSDTPEHTLNKVMEIVMKRLGK